MFYVGTDTYLMDEEKYSAITSQLGALERKLKRKLGGPGFIVIGCRCRFPCNPLRKLLTVLHPFGGIQILATLPPRDFKLFLLI